VQANWTATSGDALILNKPTIPTDFVSAANGGTFGGDISAPSFIGKLMGGATGAPDATIWCVSGDYTNWGIFYDENTPDVIQFKSGGTTTASIALDNGNINTSGTLTASGYNNSNWNTAYGWGDHADEGYLSNDANYLKSNAADSFSGILTGTSAGENLKIGGIRGTTKGSQTGQYIHLYERVHIGGPSGWGASTHGAPGSGLSTWGSANFGMNATGVLQLNGTTFLTKDRLLQNVTNTKWDTAYGWGNHASAGYLTRSKPESPKISSAIVGETIEVVITASGTSNIDQYLVFSSVVGSDFGLISVIPPDDFSASMSVIDNSFDAGGETEYRVYAVKQGVYSDVATTSQTFTVGTLEPTLMSVVSLNNAHYVQWDAPSSKSRFVSVYNVYHHDHDTESSLARASATLIYSGTNTSYMKPTSNNKFHKFWVEITNT
jgi:hypothetical protein